MTLEAEQVGTDMEGPGMISIIEILGGGEPLTLQFRTALLNNQKDKIREYCEWAMDNLMTG